MTPHFTLADFEASATAKAKRIDNALPTNLMPAALATLEMLERIRAHLCALAGHDVPIIISSGYRSPALNAAIGSTSTSDHPKGMAADWTAPRFGSPFDICTALAPHVSGLAIGQLINERVRGGAWVHTSTRMPLSAANRIITIGDAGTVVGIVAA